MSYALWLDDERWPGFLFYLEAQGDVGAHVTRMASAQVGDQGEDSYGPWVVARTYEEAVRILGTGCPRIISFDHDLGTEKSGFDVAKTLVDMDMDGVIRIPDDFHWFVHSRNPVGGENIDAYLKNYMEKGR